MASYNRVVLVGNLTRDPELRTFQSGAIVARIGLAVNERRKDQNGNMVEEANFFDVDVWNRNAEVLRDYAGKGSNILVEGKLKQDSWEQDGQKRSKILVVAERVLLLGSRGDGNGSSSNGYQQQSGYQSGYQQQGSYQQQASGNRRQPVRPSSDSNFSSNSEFNQEGADDIPF